ncbi:MAG: hypothetical protein WAM12_20830 [Pseudolabrys sp.]
MAASIAVVSGEASTGTMDIVTVAMPMAIGPTGAWVQAGAAGVAAGAYAYDNGYGYTYDNGNGYGMTYQGGPRSPYYQRSYGYDSLYRNWTEF